ncbi:MAG: hypothetical protein ABL993_00910 [Vicinamibacterales bacterium]
MAREELDFDHRDMTKAEGDVDKNLAVRFYKMPMQNAAESDKAGRPIFEDVDMCEIRVRGDRNNVIIRPVRPGDKKRFRDSWRDYQDGNERKLTGTPLAEWPPMTGSMVEEMKYLQFFTVEQLAEANDDVCGRIPGLVSLKQKARAYIELAKGSAPIEEMQRKLDSEKAAREASDNMVKDLAARISAMEAAASPLAKMQGGPAVKK